MIIRRFAYVPDTAPKRAANSFFAEPDTLMLPMMPWICTNEITKMPISSQNPMPPAVNNSKLAAATRSLIASQPPIAIRPPGMSRIEKITIRMP